MQGIATGSEGVTQLADTRPQFDTPLRNNKYIYIYIFHYYNIFLIINKF
jgi:hypothetical protein